MHKQYDGLFNSFYKCHLCYYLKIAWLTAHAELLYSLLMAKYTECDG